MNETDLFVALITVINQQLTNNGYTGISVAQAYQSGQRTSPDPGEGLYLHIVGKPRYGHPKSKSVYNESTGFFERKDTHIRVWQVQISAVTGEIDPDDFTARTSGDLASLAADLLQNDEALDLLRSEGLAIERITEIRPSYALDEREQEELNASFDIIVSSKKTYNHNVERVVDQEYTITGV